MGPERARAVFFAKTDRSAGPDGCWPWTASRNRDGYGQFMFRREPQAHRSTWLLFKGPIPDGLLVLHRCDNPPCCNPSHLFLGTFADNLHDAIAKGRQRVRGEENPNAKLTAADVASIKSTPVARFGAKASLARKYGVSKTTITRIFKGHNWRE